MSLSVDRATRGEYEDEAADTEHQLPLPQRPPSTLYPLLQRCTQLNLYPSHLVGLRRAEE